MVDLISFLWSTIGCQPPVLAWISHVVHSLTLPSFCRAAHTMSKKQKTKRQLAEQIARIAAEIGGLSSDDDDDDDDDDGDCCSGDDTPGKKTSRSTGSTGFTPERKRQKPGGRRKAQGTVSMLDFFKKGAAASRANAECSRRGHPGECDSDDNEPAVISAVGAKGKQVWLGKGESASAVLSVLPKAKGAAMSKERKLPLRKSGTSSSTHRAAMASAHRRHQKGHTNSA